MNVECTQGKGYQLVSCRGILGRSADGPFLDAIYPMFEEEGTKVLIDLSGVEWINSEGIAVLVRLVTKARTQSCHLVLAAPNAFVDEVLKKKQLDRFFEIASTRQQAIEILLTDDA